MAWQGTNELMIFLGYQDFMINGLKHWKYPKVIDVMVTPSCPKTPADPILETHNVECGYVCLHGITCHTAISIIWHTKNVYPCKIRLPIQFQFKIFQFNSNSIHVELNLLSIQFNSWIDPSPDSIGLNYDIYAELQVTLCVMKVSMCHHTHHSNHWHC